MNDVFPFRPAVDAAPAAWVIDNLLEFGGSVLSIVPAGFAAYARVYHPPMQMIHGTWTATRWADVASTTSRIAHRQMHAGSIAGGL